MSSRLIIEEGYSDFFCRKSCPYEEGTNKCRAWEEGFNKAEREYLEWCKEKGLCPDE